VLSQGRTNYVARKLPARVGRLGVAPTDVGRENPLNKRCPYKLAQYVATRK